MRVLGRLPVGSLRCVIVLAGLVAVAACHDPPAAPEVFISAIAAGDDFTCAVHEVGQAACWGAGEDGQLGYGGRDFRSSPVAVLTRERFVQIVAGVAHVCALTAEGATWCWGNNLGGQLGVDGVISAELPRLVASAPALSRIAAGQVHTCGIGAADGRVYCWGGNLSGELGDGTRTSRRTPAPITAPGPFVDITAGSDHTCVLDASGAASCWGANFFHQMGLPDSLNYDTAVAVPTSLRFVSLTAGPAYTCGLTTDSLAYCWGFNGNGELGPGAQSVTSAVPVAVTSAKFMTISAGPTHTCGVFVGGSTACWGDNRLGQLGDPLLVTHRPAVTVQAVSAPFVAVSASRVYSCGITYFGDVFCWGYNAQNQLGSNQVTAPISLSPVRVPLP